MFDKTSYDGHNFGRTKKLLDILLTRTNGFDELQEALQATRQTGASDILQVGNTGWNKLEDLRVQLGVGGEVLLKELIPLDDIHSHILSEETKRLLKELYDKQISVLKLDEDLQKENSFYIKRSLSNRLFLDPKIFTLDISAVFVFEGIRRSDLAKFIEPYTAICSSTIMQQKYTRSRHILLDKLEDWDDLITMTAPSAIHLVRREDENFVLQTSVRGTEKIREHSIKSNRTTEIYVKEDEFVSQLQDGYAAKGACLCDVPGMGKTWLIRSIARQIQAKCQNAAVFVVQMSLLSEYLNETNWTIDENDPILTILEFACSTSLAARILNQFVQQNGKKLYLFLDGLDEVRPSQLELTKLFLKSLGKFDKGTVATVISTRPPLRGFLEKVFGVISYDILPFEKEEQISALIYYWSAMTDEELCKNRLGEFANHCIQMSKTLKKNGDPDVLGVPLKCSILAVVNEDYAIRFAKNPFWEPEVVCIDSVIDLYSKHVEQAFSKVEKSMLQAKVKKSDVTARKVDIIKYHTMVALKILYPEFAEKYIRYHQLQEIPLQDTPQDTKIICLGIIYYDGQNYNFFHRSFAEYFVGQYFADFWMACDTQPFGLDRSASNFFVRTLLRTAKSVLVNMPKNDDSYDHIQMRTYQFENTSVLWFMNNHLGKNPFAGNFQLKLENFKKSLKKQGHKVSQLSTVRLIPIVNNFNKSTYFKNGIKEKAYEILQACIIEGYANLLCLLKHIFAVFFAGDVSVLLEAPFKNFKLIRSSTSYIENLKWLAKYRKNESLAFIVYWISMKASLPTAQEFFCTFSNESNKWFLGKFCGDFPTHWASPLEIAISQNNPSIFNFFLNKTKVAGERLIMQFLLGEAFSESELQTRIELYKSYKERHESTFLHIQIDALSNNIAHAARKQTFNLRLIKYILPDLHIRLQELSIECQLCLLSGAIEHYNDEQFLEIFVLLFEKSRPLSPPYQTTLDNTNEDKIQYDNVTAEEILESMNETRATNAFKKLTCNADMLCSGIRKLETLRLLTRICKDLTQCNTYKQNYLHIAVKNGNFDWVRFLIDCNHNVNQTDKNGNTPILCLSDKEALKITKLLAYHKADICAQDNEGENIAHKMVSKFASKSESFFHEWTTYTLQNGYTNLWVQNNNHGISPTELLDSVQGRSRDIHGEIRSKMNEMTYASGTIFH